MESQSASSGWVLGSIGILICLCIWCHKPSWLVWCPRPLLLFCMNILPEVLTHIFCQFILFDGFGLLLASCATRISVVYLCEVLFIRGVLLSTLGFYIVIFRGFVLSCACCLNILASESMASICLAPICSYGSFGIVCFN